MLDGPRMPPAAGGRPTFLIVLCHGYGSNGDDLIGLAPYWAKALPHAQFVSPNAPEPLAGMPGAYQWWDFSQRDPGGVGLVTAGKALNAFMDAELNRYGLDGGQLALVGFSQGTMMALDVGLRRARPPAAIVGFSGAMLRVAGLKEQPPRPAPQVCLIHGDGDDRIPLSSSLEAANALCEAGLSAQWHISYGCGHAIAQDGLDLAGAFLKMSLNRQAALLA